MVYKGSTMNEYLGLSPKQLSRLSHHWFWGLQIDENDIENFYQKALYLNEHHDECEQIIALLISINRYPWVVRAFLWLFNLFDYRNHYYALQTLICLQNYQQGLQMLSPEERQNVEIIGGLIIVTAVTFQYASPISQLALQTLSHGLNWVQNQFKSALSQNFPIIQKTDHSLAHSSEELVPLHHQPDIEEVLIENEPPELQEMFVVKKINLWDLQYLNITAQPGDVISLSALKAAYRDSLRRTHPDKTGIHSEGLFRDVQNAMKNLLIFIHSQKPEVVDEFQSQLDAVSGELKHEFEQWKALRKQVKTYQENADRYIANADRYIANADRYIANADRYIANADRYIASTTELNTQMKNYIASSDKLQAEGRELIEMYQKATKAILDQQKEKNQHRPILFPIRKVKILTALKHPKSVSMFHPKKTNKQSGMDQKQLKHGNGM